MGRCNTYTKIFIVKDIGSIEVYEFMVKKNLCVCVCIKLFITKFRGEFYRTQATVSYDI